jgi:hypothetical protein
MLTSRIISHIVLCGIVIGFILPHFNATAGSNAKKITVNLNDSGVDDVDILAADGTIYPGKTTGNKVKFSLATNKLNRASIIAFSDGQLIGSVGVIKQGKLKFRLLGSPKNIGGESLSKINIKLNSWTSGAPYVSTSVKGKIFSATGSVATSSIQNLGLNITDVEGAAKKKISAHATITGLASDSDGDGLPALYDVDTDGDGIIDIADASIDTGAELSSQAGGGGGGENNASGIELPFTTLYLAMPNTVNWHINGAIDASEIDAVIGGSNIFAIAFYFSFSGSDTVASTITGGYGVCPDALEYCRPTSVGASTGVYSGFSEGDNTLPGQLWSSLNASGHENSLENLPANGGEGDTVWAASIQPRVGTDKFRPGDTYRVDFVNSSDTVVARKSLTLPPYFLTVPAIRSYNITDNDDSNDVLVDYTDTNGPGMTNGTPIVLPSTGPFTGKLRLVVSRLQRKAVAGLEEGDYRDFGHLNYGVIISNNSGEFSCGELYENLSSTLTELPSVGEGNSYRPSDGALLWPLVDSADDYAPSNASDTTTVGNNTIAFTVDLASCLDRNSLAPGVHQITITAAGEDTGHGSNRAAQTVYVNIP